MKDVNKSTFISEHSKIMNDRQGYGLSSRKLCVIIIAIAAIITITVIGAMMDDIDKIGPIVTAIAGVAGAYSLGQGYADGQKSKNMQN